MVLADMAGCIDRAHERSSTEPEEQTERGGARPWPPCPVPPGGHRSQCSAAQALLQLMDKSNCNWGL